MDLHNKIIENFKALVAIPRSSKDEKRVSDFLLNYAKERGFEAKQDDKWNLIIKVPGTCKKENNPSCVLQGHMDMVYVKTPESTHVYEDGINVVFDGDYMKSDKNTSLGADNGIALAYCMTIMDDMTIPHPPLEIIFTVEEEVGLTGASYLDCSSIKSKLFINLDSEHEGEFFTSCSGGIRNYFTVPMGEKEKAAGLTNYEIRVFGLKGGHSGVDIDCGRANGIKLLARLLKYADSPSVHLSSFNYDGKANSIPIASKAFVGVEKGKEAEFENLLEKCFADIKNEYRYTDTPDYSVKAAENTDYYYRQKSKDTLYNALTLLPNGVISKSFAIEGLTETSVNIGSAEEKDGNIRLLSSARSCVASRKYAVVEQIETIAKLCGCESENFNDYPQWDYNPNSPLRELALKAYKEMSKEEGSCASIHGGLECGYFCDKIQGCDIISMGCNLYDVHTPNERVSIKSVFNVWELLLEILRRL